LKNRPQSQSHIAKKCERSRFSFVTTICLQSVQLVTLCNVTSGSKTHNRWQRWGKKFHGIWNIFGFGMPTNYYAAKSGNQPLCLHVLCFFIFYHEFYFIH
jgi:hypothetical protein